MYLPTISKAQNVSNYAIGPYIAAVFTDCESVGMIEYKHVVMVYERDPEAEEGEQIKPVMAVAAEMASALLPIIEKEEGSASYFLGVFDGNGHANLGKSTEWGNLDHFKKKALEIIQSHLQINQAPQIISKMN